jgi:hypothetical protein
MPLFGEEASCHQAEPARRPGDEDLAMSVYSTRLIQDGLYFGLASVA